MPHTSNIEIHSHGESHAGKTATDDQQLRPLSRSTIVRYAAGSLATGGFSSLPGLVLVYYLTDSLGVAALAAGAIVTVAKIWDVLIAPIVGGLSDRAARHRGTRRGLMVVGAIGLPITFILTFAVPAGLSPLASGLWVFIAFTAAATFFSAFQVPYIALPAELTPNYRERTRLLSWRVVVLTIAILLFGAGGPEVRGLFPNDSLLGYLVMGIVAAAVLAMGLAIGTTVAPRHSPTSSRALQTSKISLADYRAGFQALRESQPFRALVTTFVLQGLATGLLLAGAQYVATWVLHAEGAVSILFASMIAPAIFFAPVWKKVADRMGKNRAYRVASGIFLLATMVLTAMLWFPGWWIVAPVAIAGTAYAGMQTLPMAMLPDVISYDAGRMRQRNATAGGNSRAGVFGGMWTAGETAGMALGSTILTVVLMATGYIESSAGALIQQPASAVTGISVAFSVLPALIMVMSLAALRRYRLTEADVEATK